jgi:hypothetical protein
MAINPNNGVLDILNGTLKVSSIDIKQAGGFTTAINTVARNDVLLYDDQDANTTFTPTQNAGYSSSSGVTRDTTAIDFNDGWVYWPLQLPNSWHTEFDILMTTTGGVLTYSLFNTSEPNHTDYTANDGGYKIVFDNTNNQIDVRWEGSVHATTSANVRSTDWQHVNINYFQGAVSISLAGKVVLTHKFTENYQEFDSRYVGFSATSGASHRIRHLIVHNSDKWLYTKTSNASDISYVSGNVGIGSLSPTELLDVHGNVHIAKDLTVDGNLTVSGTTTFIDTQNLAIEDPIIEVARGNSSDTIDAGLVITRASSNVAVAYRGDEEELALAYTQSGASDTDVTPIADGGLDVRVYGNLFANNLTTTANVEATYLKGNGSEITHVTLDQVVDYGNTTANTIQLTNADVGLKADGNIQANYFIGNGSQLDGISSTLQQITDNGNVTTNTIQFTNTTTAFVADSNVGIGTDTPDANLHVVGHQYVNDPPTIANSFDHSDAPLTLTHGTPTSTTAIDDPKPVLHLTRDGTQNEAYGARASFNLSRYENSGTASRSRLDVALTDGTYAESNVMSIRADGKVGIGTTSPAYTLDVHGTANVGALTATSISGPLTGNADTATALETARTIGGVSFDGTANIDLPGVNTAGTQDTSGNADTATALETARTIGGVSFDGTANIDLPGVNTAGTQDTSGNADTATALETARTIGGVSFDGTANIDLPGVNTAGTQDTSGNAATATTATNQSGGSVSATGGTFTGNVGIGTASPVVKLDVVGGNIGLDYGRAIEVSPSIASSWTNGTTKLIETGWGTGDEVRFFTPGSQSSTQKMVINSNGNVGIGQSTPSKKLDVSGDINFTGQLYRNGYLYSGWTEVNINSPDATSGTWHTNTNTSNWGTPKFNTTYDQYAYNDAPGYREYDIPSGMATAYVSQLQWSGGGYVDVHGVQSDGGLVFLRRINTRQLVENSNEGNPDQHDGSTITLAATGLQHYTSIRFTNKVGRFHMTGLAFTPKTNRGAEGTGMVHSAQISDLGTSSGIPTSTGTGANGTWGINITGSSGSCTGNSATASSAATLSGVTINNIFNNMGGNHSNRTDFNAIPDAGSYYVTGSTNGPGVNGANQYYGFTLGLGTDYAPVKNQAGKYGTQIYWGRNVSNPYINIRYLENGSWGSWQKASAGYADSAGSATTATTATNQSGGTVTCTSGTFSGTFSASTASSRDKFRVYPTSQYCIGMQSGVTYGDLNDWSMTFQMNNEDDRGFWWGDDGHGVNQGAMALSTRGWLNVAERIKVGGGQTDTGAASYPLHVVGTSYFTNTLNIQPSSSGGGQNIFTGYRTGDSYGRAQLVLSSGYSDLIIASSQANNNHGSNLSFVTYNPSNAADYRKFVINQGNWGSRKQFLDFGYGDKVDSNPHGYINSTDTVLTLDGINKRVGIRNINPGYTLDVNGNARINRLLPYSSSYSSAYNTAAIEVREYNLECATGGTEWARAPRIGFHWCGRIASQILCESNGRISVVNNPGNAYEAFGAGSIYCSGTIEADGRIYADAGCHVRGDWLRVNGQNGIYFESYGGGWRMTDSTWVRIYNGKSLWCENGIMATNYRCGVGTSSPHVPLHVYGTGASVNNGSFRYMSVSGSGSGYGTWGALCASFEGGHVRSTDSFLAHNGSLNTSDERIKKEISDINDASALETLRLIQPKTYKYKDEEKMGSDVVYGFIAQQIQEVLPYATKTLTEYLPSICELSNVTQSNVITFTNFNTNDLLSNTTIIQAQLFRGENKDLTISEIIDEHSIRVEEDLTEMLHEDETRLYIYGEQVDDFLFLKKESIFTVATAALQEVDRQLQAEKAKVATLETQLASVLARLDALENPPS